MPDLQQGKAEKDEGVEHTQEHYDRAAWDYLTDLNAMDRDAREARFRRQEWLARWQPEAATRCPKCGDTVLELKWSEDHIQWQCLEPTCRHDWSWRKR